MTEQGTRQLTRLLAVLFLLGHLPLLASTLEDIDSVNFALGLTSFDVAAHRPHPPGYPVFIALGRASRALFSFVPSLASSEQALAARTLSVWGALAGALAVFALVSLYRSFELDRRRALAAATLTVVCPLFWFNASRPLTDVTGLALALAAQALLLTVFLELRRDSVEPGPPSRSVNSGSRLRWTSHESWSWRARLLTGAAVAALAIGVRSQTLWLTVPILLLTLARVARRGGATQVGRASAAFALATAAWALPLVIASGGPSAYLNAFASQAGEDIAGVDMLATNPTLRRLVFALDHTFVLPWMSRDLANVILVLAVIGGVTLLLRRRMTLGLMSLLFLPYTIFHLWLQETLTTRYALPIVVPVAYLVVCGLDRFHRYVLPVTVGALVIVSLVVTLPAQVRYAREGSPLFRAVDDMSKSAQPAPVTPMVAMHHAFERALRGEVTTRDALVAPPGREIARVTDSWLGSGTQPIWFLADPRRTDLQLLDPVSLTLRGAYRWNFRTEALLGGVRPSDTDWYAIERPGWFLGDGWAITPETAGRATFAGLGPAKGGVTAHVVPRQEPATLMIGGRNLGSTNDPAVTFVVAIDGRELDRWPVPVEPRFFLKMWELPAGALVSDRPFIELRVQAEAPAGSAQAAVEQFNLQPPHEVVFGFDQGWHEHEYNPATGRSWRWSSDSATLRIRPTGTDLRLRIVGELPPVEGGPADVTVRVGEQEIARSSGTSRVTLETILSAHLLASTGGVVTVETSKVDVPSERSGSPDQRRLGLRAYEVRVEPLK